MRESRTINSIKNFSTGLIAQMINKILAFITRTIFIRVLSTEYLGLNGLFTNILSVLSFAELGIGTAIVFNMYKPIAVNDKEKIKSLVLLYKKCYFIIGCIIFVFGIFVIPFIPYMTKDTKSITDNISIIYLLFLFNTSISYFFSYKKSIITAYQKERIINMISCVFAIALCFFQSIFLIITKNYIVFLIVQICCNTIENIYMYHKANNLFPFIKEKNVVSLTKKEKRNIYSNVKDLAIYKVGSTILSGTDNIIISIIINVSTVGICSNYILIIESIRSLLTSAFNGVTASIGNLNVEADVRKKEEILFQYNLISFWIYSFCAIAFMVLLNNFIEIWLGSKYILPITVPISLALSFWVIGMRMPAYTYRVVMGLFNKGRSAPFIAVIINIVLSVILGSIMGVAGIFFATSISQLLSFSWIDPHIIYKYELKKSVKEYWKKHIAYTTIFIICSILTIFLTSFIKTGLIGLIIRTIIVLVIPNAIYYILFHKSSEFIEVKKKLNGIKENYKGRKKIYE